MKRLLNNFLKTRIPQVVILLACIALVTAFAGSKKGSGKYKLGGTWVGRMPGVFGDVTWITTYSPDSSGRNATVTTEWITDGDFGPLVSAPIGADRSSIASGYTRMTGKDTAVMEATWYLAGPSDEPTFGLDEIKGIGVLTGDLRFTDPSTCVGTYHMKVYKTGSDASMVPTEAMPLVFDSERDLPASMTTVNNIVF